MKKLWLAFASVVLLSFAVLGWTGSVNAAGTVEAGQAKSATCMACHGMDGKGNVALGAPNLTDDIWLHAALIGPRLPKRGT